ncbi:MAG TPA: hypothetical protein VIK04_16995 [Solirubrobacteraceae bacterium]
MSLAGSRRLAGCAPLIVLALVSALSLGARAYQLGAPCVSPCRTVSDRALMLDESVYVEAAQVVAGIRPPRTLAAGLFPSNQGRRAVPTPTPNIPRAPSW